MASVKTEMELEIAHVLFIDTVGYSKLLINEQRDLLEQLNRVVRSTNRFRAAESAGTLIRLPTGDGMALVFSDSLEAPAECALEISQALKGSAHLPLRMGIHSGPVSRVVDVNDRSNAAGAGINIAQRVMSCGDAGHILFSKHSADDLIEYARWSPFLHEIGECEVKHGSRIGLVNFYSDEFGNPNLPARCQEFHQRDGSRAKAGFAGWRKIAFIGAASMIALALVLVLYAVFFAKPLQSRVSQNFTPSIPEKSIAVLPFDNLSDDKGNAYFADGVQDEILTALSKVADIKVISRTSVMAFRDSAQRNLRDIAKLLGVAYVMEGTVQRFGNQIRIRAQLIDARSDTHVWGESYSREIADVFALESELAQKIASQLKSRISPQEKAAIEERPTTNLVAYDLYARAKALIADAIFDSRRAETLAEAVRLLTEAVQRDPTFVLAYYQLAHAHDQLYFTDVDHTPARLKLASDAVEAVQRLHPGSGEAHLALAKHLYWGGLDLNRARQELIAARRALPNDPLPFLLAGYIDRRQGRWDDSIRGMEQALQLDPRNVSILQQISLSYENLRRYSDAAATLDRALTLAPQDVNIRVRRANIELEWHADTKPLHSTIDAIIVENPAAAGSVAERWMELALYEHDGNAAARAIAAMHADRCDPPMPRAWCEGLVAQTKGDDTAARAAFSIARLELEKIVRELPDYAEALKGLGTVDAVLGNKEDAIQYGRRAMELAPVSKDAVAGPGFVRGLAVIYALAGEKNLALDQLEIAVHLPSYLSYGELRLHPDWNPLRGDPRFEKIVASLAPEASVP